MGVDATVVAAIQDAEIAVTVEELRRQLSRGGDGTFRHDVSDELLSQVGGVPGELKAEVTSTAVMFTLWNRETGEPSQISFDALQAHLLVRFDRDHPMAGELVWTSKPMEPMVGGTLLCPLHKDHSDHALMVQIGGGAKACTRDRLRTVLDVDRHVKHRHPDLFDRLERKRQDDKDAENRVFMREQTEALRTMAETRTPPSTPPAKTRNETPEQREARLEVLRRGRATRLANVEAKALAGG